MIFARLPRATHQRLKSAGAAYALYEGPLETGAPDAPSWRDSSATGPSARTRSTAFWSLRRGEARITLRRGWFGLKRTLG